MREHEIVDGRYRIARRIAAGGFGAIYQATDIVMGREVALKVLHHELSGDVALVARFRREAEALARLRDPHTITMYDVGQAADGTHFIVLELLRGESLHTQFSTMGAMPWRRVALIARGVCSSLGEAHALGIIHRDLKPANIHLETSAIQQDFAKVLDFGIAKLVDADSTAFPDLTLAGQMIGTFDYMPPEQLIGGACSGKSDVFALAVVMYEMIAGQRPFGEAQGPAGRLMTMLSTEPVALAQRADVPAPLDAIVMRALSRELDERPDVGELDAVLAGLIEDSAITRRAPSAADTVPSDISAMIDEALDEASDDEDTWVGEAPKPTVVGLAPTRAPAPHGEEPTKHARPMTTRFAVGSRTELPPAKGLWSDARLTPRRLPAERPAQVVALSVSVENTVASVGNDAITARRVAHARTIVPADVPPRLPNIAFTPAPSLRPTPSEVALPPTPAVAAMFAATMAMPTQPSVPTLAQTMPAMTPMSTQPAAPTFALGTSPALPPKTKGSAVRYAIWALALFGAGFAAAVGFSQL